MQIFVEQRKGTKFSSIIVPKENQYLSLARSTLQLVAIYTPSKKRTKVHLAPLIKY